MVIAYLLGGYATSPTHIGKDAGPYPDAIDKYTNSGQKRVKSLIDLPLEKEGIGSL